MTTLTDLVNESLKRNLLHNIVLTQSEIVFLNTELSKIGTIGVTDTNLLSSILSKLNLSRYDK